MVEPMQAAAEIETMNGSRATRLRCDVAVVGGGVIGLSAAWHLARRGAGRVLLLEGAHPGHEGGGSHGATRIFRSAYDDPRYARLARLARRTGWPALESAAGRTLLFPRRACFFGPADGPLAEYAAAMGASGAPVRPLSVASARRRFPELRFAEDGQLILDDQSAAVIAAADTMAALVRLAEESGVAIARGHRVQALHATPGGVRLDALAVGGGGRPVGDPAPSALAPIVVEAGAVVVAAGFASAALVGLPPQALRAARQWVGYWRRAGEQEPATSPSPATSADASPLWAYVGHEADTFFYGLPAWGSPGAKAARHVTMGPGLPGPETASDIAAARAAREADRVRAALGRLWSQPPEALMRSEHCVYTMSPDGHLLLGAMPDQPRVILATGGSGHAFKFAPLLGRIVAELVLDDAPSDLEVRALMAEWSPARDAVQRAASCSEA